MSCELDFELVREGVLNAINVSDFKALHHLEGILVRGLRDLIHNSNSISVNDIENLRKAK